MSKQVMLEVIETENLSLEDWLHLVFNPPKDKVFHNAAFPTERHRQEYITTINDRSDEEVIRLLSSFLIKSGSLYFFDAIHLESLRYLKNVDPDQYDYKLRTQFYKRLILNAAGHKEILPWEGITWVLDLLPFSPKRALDTLDAYVFAHFYALPDNRLYSLLDAAEVIRAKYIGLPESQNDRVDTLKNIQPRQFEHLVDRLFDRLGYETELTPPQKDGGRDIIARSQKTGKLESIFVECKRYHDKVDVKIVRSLLGIVADEKVNKGVLVTTGRFTKGAIALATRNPRLELISGTQLVLLMNEYLGSNWPLRIERLVIESEKANKLNAIE